MPADRIVAESILEYNSLKLKDGKDLSPDDAYALIIELEEKMQKAADNLDFEIAAGFRDEIKKIRSKFL